MGLCFSGQDFLLLETVNRKLNSFRLRILTSPFLIASAMSVALLNSNESVTGGIRIRFRAHSQNSGARRKFSTRRMIPTIRTPTSMLQKKRTHNVLTSVLVNLIVYKTGGKEPRL